jgi:hypothetical protein
MSEQQNNWKEFLSSIDAPYLEEWALVGCGVTDEELEAIARNVISKYKTITLVDMSSNKIRCPTRTTMAYFPKTLRIFILNDNPILCEQPHKDHGTCSSSLGASSVSVIKDLLTYFPYLGYLGEDLSKYTRSCCSPEETFELHRIMKENRNRLRMEEFRARLVDGGHHFVIGLWPIMIQNALRALKASIWDDDDDDDGGNDDVTGKSRCNNYSGLFSIFKPANKEGGGGGGDEELSQIDAIYLMLSMRGADEIFR